MKKFISKKSESLSEWYTDVILKSRLADYSPVKGCMVIRPNGYGIWENIQKAFDPMLKELGVENSYFPMFIPMSFLSREAKHVEGFSPELAVVTHGGGEKLAEDLAVRPTSETIMYEMFHKWVESYRDLPLCLNQWNNVVRWEKRTYLFLRTTEFLWSEAHTAHATKEEAEQMVYSGLKKYQEVAQDYLAVPVFRGLKSENEKFAGADFTTCIEAMMPDGKALQAGTSHSLGQNFSKKEAFDINFQDETGKLQYVWQTSYGITTRIIGAIIMVHGDDNGLCLPPKVAPTQILLVPVENSPKIIEACQNIEKQLKAQNVRVKILKDETHSLGYKLNECEIQGIPLYAAIGNKEIESEIFKFKVRHSGEEIPLKLNEVSQKVTQKLEQIHNEMFEKALKIRDGYITKVETYDEFKKIMETKRGFLKAHWCEDPSCEKAIKEDTKAVTRCLPFVGDTNEVETSSGKCIRCGKDSVHEWLFALSY